jgi:FKBP-type peptidyl-prolyl cis-trans isomerase
MRALSVSISVCVGLTIVGCGGGDDHSSVSTNTASSAAKVANASGPGPVIRLRAGAPPKKIVVRNVKDGSGHRVTWGDRVTVRYVGFSWDGGVYSNYWTRVRPSFVLGSRKFTTHGFDAGIRGMRVGGRREIILPPSARRKPGVKSGGHPSSEAMVYILELLKARPEVDTLRNVSGH